jgi:ABC-type sugar transport system permease subunit
MMTLFIFELAEFTIVTVYVRGAPDCTGSALSVFVIEKGLPGSADAMVAASAINAPMATITARWPSLPA